MSTKIYNGFRFKNPDMLTIRRQLVRLQGPVADYTAAMKAELLASAALKLFTEPDEYDAKLGPMSEARKRVGTLLMEAEKSKTHTEFDFKFEVVMITVRRNLTLGMHFTEQRGLEKLLREQPWFEDYHFQNQTDMPGDATKAEWRKRAEDWDVALGHESPARRGFAMDLHEPYWFFVHDIPSTDVLPLVRKKRPETTLADLVGAEAAERLLAHRGRGVPEVFA